MKKNMALYTITVLLIFFSLIASAMEVETADTYIGDENSFFWDLDLQKIQDSSNVNYLYENHIEDCIFKKIVANTLKKFIDLNNYFIVNILMRAVKFRNKLYPYVNYENVVKELTQDLREAGVYEVDLIKAFLDQVSYFKTKKPLARLASKDTYQAFEILRYEPITIEQAYEDLVEAMHVTHR